MSDMDANTLDAADDPDRDEGAAGAAPPPGPLRRMATTVLALGFSGFHLYTGAFGLYDVPIQNGIHLLLALLLALMIRPSAPFRLPQGRLLARGYDLVVMAAAIAPLIYRLWYNTYLTAGRFEFVTPLTPLETVLGIACVFAVLDICRRVAGWPLVGIILVAILYPFLTGLPGILAHGAYTVSMQLDAYYMTSSGIFGVPLSASADYIALFIIFGAFLEKSGLGQMVIDFSVGLVGQHRGGPAKVAVFASALTGSISGSAPANVMTTGVLTIPLMKRLGFPAAQAGAIEAAASTGGVLMPPVMGSIAFIMAQYTGVPYLTIAFYALIPALLYYLGVFLTVHWAAVRHGIPGVPRDELPDWRHSLWRRGHLAIPLVMLLVLMYQGYSPQYAVTYSTIAVVVLSWLRPETRMGWRDILSAMENGARGAVIVAVATAAAGILVAVLELTGLGLRFAQGASGAVSSVFLGMVITMVVSVILGMGVPPSVAYIAQIAVTIPMLMNFLQADGVPQYTAMISAHFFVLYYSALAVLTPPDALASIAAAGIAGSPVIRTASKATRVAFVAFVVPYMFVYRPALLTLGSPMEILAAVAAAGAGIVLFSMALEGCGLRPLGRAERLLAGLSGALFLIPSIIGNGAAIALALALVLLQLRGRQQGAATPAPRQQMVPPHD